MRFWYRGKDLETYGNATEHDEKDLETYSNATEPDEKDLETYRNAIEHDEKGYNKWCWCLDIGYKPFDNYESNKQDATI